MRAATITGTTNFRCIISLPTCESVRLAVSVAQAALELNRW
jgi:hypothetical protein